MRKSIVVLGVVILVLAAVVAVFLARPELAENLFRSKVVVTDGAKVDEIVSVFVRNPYKDDYGISRIPGHVQNLSGEDVAGVDLEITLWEKENRKEVVLFTVENVPAGQTVSFDANAGAIGGPRTAQVKVVNLEVYR
jgi:hypothetical protein